MPTAPTATPFWSTTARSPPARSRAKSPSINFPRPPNYCAAKGYNPRQTVVATQDYYDDGTRKSPRYYPPCPEVKSLTDAVTMIDNDPNGGFCS